MAASPAIQEFVKDFPTRITFGQVDIQASESGFILRHVADREATESLQQVPPAKLRAIVDKTTEGAYRPLRSAPNLAQGWRCEVVNPEELENALNHLYPGAIADWFANKNGISPVSYREYTGRQTGMYRITTFLEDQATDQMADACCSSAFCLKDRRWGLNAANPAGVEKYSIPCLEPCAILLEFARKAVRLSQEKQTEVQLSESEVKILLTALSAPPEEDPDRREADFADLRNSRLRQLLISRLQEAQQNLQDQTES